MKFGLKMQSLNKFKWGKKFLTRSGNLRDFEQVEGEASNLSKKDFEKLLKFFSDYYYNDESLISDKKYDRLVSIYEGLFGKCESFGALPRNSGVKLPHYLCSLDKIKTKKEYELWTKDYDGDLLVEDKIDGMTLLIYMEKESNGKLNVKLFTRGDHEIAEEVTHIKDYILIPEWIKTGKIPKNVRFYDNKLSVRGEIYLKPSDLETISKSTGKNYKSARNVVPGLLRTKNRDVSFELSHLYFYAYRVVQSEESPEKQRELLNIMGFNVPSFEIINSNNVTIEKLEDILIQRKEVSENETDGLVLYRNQNVEYPTGRNPVDVKSFKGQDDEFVTTVLDVEWGSGSKNRLLKPVVIYDAVDVVSANLNRATGHNARFVINNNIGPGAVVVICRSNEVIPKVVRVIKGAESGAKYPDSDLKYEWNETQVEFILTEDTVGVCASKLEYFIKALGIKNMGGQRLNSLAENGILTINDLLRVSIDELVEIDGIGSKIAQDFVKTLHSTLESVHLYQIMDASRFFPNLGPKLLESICDNIDDLIETDYDKETLQAKVSQIRGFKTRSKVFAENYKPFKVWLASNSEFIKLNTDKTLIVAPKTFKTSPSKTSPNKTVKSYDESLSGKVFVLSGTREKQVPELVNIVKQSGGRFASGISSKVTHLLMVDTNDKKGKALKALELNRKLSVDKQIQIVSIQDFMNQYQ